MHYFISLTRSISDFLLIFNVSFIFFFPLQRVLQHQEDSALLKAYIAEWGKFFTQCGYLPKPFCQLEASLAGKAHNTMPKKSQGEESIVRKVSKFAKDNIEKYIKRYVYVFYLITAAITWILSASKSVTLNKLAHLMVVIFNVIFCIFTSSGCSNCNFIASLKL